MTFTIVNYYIEGFYVKEQKDFIRIIQLKIKLHYLLLGLLFNYDVCYPHNCKYIGPQPPNTDAHRLSSRKSQTEKRCRAELSRLAAILEIMSECLNASLVRWLLISATYTHIGVLHAVLRETSITFSSQPSVLHIRPSPCCLVSALFLLYRPDSHIYGFPLTIYPSVALLSSSYITPPFLVSPLHQSCPHSFPLPCFSLYPLSDSR